MIPPIDKCLKQKQQHINDFVRRANAILPLDNPLYFDGHFISGQTYRPDVLFIGINPGHRDWDNIEGRRAGIKLIDYHSTPCKYIAEAEAGNRFAKRIINVVCDNEVSRLKHCAETSLLSYFASPREHVVQKQIKALPKAMQREHKQLTELPLEQLRPRHIVCIGWRTFDEFMNRYAQHADTSISRASTKKLPIQMKGVEKMMDYYSRVELEGISVHGVRHFSTPLSHAMLDDLKTIFKSVWEDIEKSKEKGSA
ncbi:MULTISPECIES: hypothetical protein [unclassified Psychrobacter]|uniref:hypothetical protein n=1 Tax=unclassified Psychrobacter TaxID=196806 RepID=UPI0025F4C8DB|nr:MULTISPECIES: hypothetical protein [unclassified Psychrobacter]